MLVQVLVMTPPVLLQNLSHCFIRIELIALLIFDECHHAQPESNHPYAEIMKVRSYYIMMLLLRHLMHLIDVHTLGDFLGNMQVFYNTSATKLPRVFGMTASPILGKGNPN